MALQADVQYVQYRVDGTAARKVQQGAEQNAQQAVYHRRKTEQRVIAVDPVALAGILLAAVVLIAMVAGLVQYRAELHDARQMNAYIQQLEQENVLLEQTYRAGYDPEEIRVAAEQAGMVSAEQAQKIELQVALPEQDPQERMSFWDSLTIFLAGIFA